MVRAIVVNNGERIFYGMREAFYDLPLETEDKQREFANDLEERMIDVNGLLGESRYKLYFKIGEKRKMFAPEKRSAVSGNSHFQDNLDYYPNIQIYAGDLMVANLISQFSSKETSGRRPRGLEIFPISVPNEHIKFNPTFLYEIGEKHGRLFWGVDFDISIGNYREIKNERK